MYQQKRALQLINYIYHNVDYVKNVHSKATLHFLPKNLVFSEKNIKIVGIDYKSNYFVIFAHRKKY